MSAPIPTPTAAEIESLIDKIKGLVSTKYTRADQPPIIPSNETISSVSDGLLRSLPEKGLGLDGAFDFLANSILPGLSNQATENYLGFVTGGVTPAALVGDYLTTLYDQNAHRYGDTVAPVVEFAALDLILNLLELEPSQWPGRLITSGATASNVLGLAVGREYVIQKASQSGEALTSKLGIHKAMIQAGLDEFQVLHCMSHSSIAKSCSILGIGSQNAISVSAPSEPWSFDLDLLEKQLATPRTGSIVVVSMGEVNTGRYTHSISKIRELCDKYNAWLHIDGAFGIYSRALRKTDSIYKDIAIQWTEGLELADSITGDSHKSLNVPYDSGFFFCRDQSIMRQVFHNPGAAYLAGNPDAPVNPLDKGIENSRRFRALPLYSTLIAYGKEGYQKLIEESISYARAVAEYIVQSPDYVLLPDDDVSQISTIVFFQAKDDELNKQLNARINSTRNIFLSGSAWNNKPAQRVAVSNWKITKDMSERVIKELKRVASEWNTHA